MAAPSFGASATARASAPCCSLVYAIRRQRVPCYDFQGQRRALHHLMLRTEPMRSVVQALIDHDGQSLDAIGGLLQGMAPLAASTAHRRERTVVSWLCGVGLARWNDAVVVYSGPQLASHAASGVHSP